MGGWPHPLCGYRDERAQSAGGGGSADRASADKRAGGGSHDRAIAGASKGWYSVELDQFHDPTASEPFATAHLRRLEALRRSGLPVEREVNGYWLIPPDHLERVEAHEQRLRARTPVTVALLNGDRIDLLPERDKATWLDREIVAEKPVDLGRGFGAGVKKGRDRRMQWLAAQRLIDLEEGDYRFRSDLVEQLERRELRVAAANIGRESGRAFREHGFGNHIEGICRGPVQVGDRKFGLVEHSREFSLVPWRPVLERQIGGEISGVVRSGGISWTIGRDRQGPTAACEPATCAASRR
jgi:hypothetical protein